MDFQKVRYRSVQNVCLVHAHKLKVGLFFAIADCGTFPCPFPSLFSVLLLSLPYAFHSLSGCAKRLVINYKKSLEMGYGYKGPFHHHYCTKTDNVGL